MHWRVKSVSPKADHCSILVALEKVRLWPTEVRASLTAKYRLFRLTDFVSHEKLQ